MPSTTISRGNILLNLILGATLTPVSVAGATTAAQTFTIPGLQLLDLITINLNGAQTAGIGIVNAFVSAANVLTVVFSNSTAGALTPAAGLYLLTADRAEYTPLPVNAS